MDGNLYATEKIVAGRLAELRADCAQAALVESARGGRRGLGSVVGAALIRAGQWVARGEAVAGPNAGVRVTR
ncbi:MAG: hypothetical protein ACREJS_09625 [Candidatus Rokuibacteriota bacterium]